MPIATVNSGVRLWYERAGDTGSAVVLVIGWRVRGLVWEQQIEHLRAAHRLVWFDNRGVGLSDVPFGPYRTSDMAADVLGLADELGLETFHLVGMSLGGMIAQEVATAARPRLRSLTLIATTSRGGTRLLPSATTLRTWARGATASDAVRRRRKLEVLFPAHFLERQDEAWVRNRYYRDFCDYAPAFGLLSQLAAAWRHQAGSKLGALAGLPTLIVQPDSDLVIPPVESSILHALVPGSRLARIEGAGHGIVRQVPEQINRLLQEHFAAADARYSACPGHGDGTAAPDSQSCNPPRLVTAE
ncbi:MAG: alpha/beta fold hydrolase [Candidatus Schekmanbacteria bacterium]|nr:alpha/beta fold hydrolase [Candidatus Schekmanbacteria bacterium]